MVNTVFDIDYDNAHLPEQRNGYVFYETDNTALESAMGRALDLWFRDRKSFLNLAEQGMEYDYSWNHPGQEYLKLYDFIRHK